MQARSGALLSSAGYCWGLLRAVPSRLLAPSGCSSPWHSALQCLLCLGAVEVCASRNAGAAPTSRSVRFVVPHG